MEGMFQKVPSPAPGMGRERHAEAAQHERLSRGVPSVPDQWAPQGPVQAGTGGAWCLQASERILRTQGAPRLAQGLRSTGWAQDPKLCQPGPDRPGPAAASVLCPPLCDSASLVAPIPASFPCGPCPRLPGTGVRVSPHQRACVQPSHTHRYTWVHLHTLASQRRETPHPQSSLCPPRQPIVIGSQGMPPIDSLTRHNHSVTVTTESSVSFITTCQPCPAAQRSPLRQRQRQQHVVPLMHQPRAHIPIPMGKSRVLARKKTTPHTS